MIFSFFVLNQAFSSYGEARKHFEKYGASKNLEELFVKMVDAKLYYSALPVIKTILAENSRTISSSTEKAISLLVQVVGVKQFESLPVRFLEKGNSSTLNYIVAKKFFRDGKHQSALNFLSKINSRHFIYPFAMNMQGTIYSVEKDYTKAYTSFSLCIRSSNLSLSNQREGHRQRLNRDYCVLGKARVQYAQRNYDHADLLYLDLPKSSPVWPEVLFEEAWNSYYQKNYNRSLGKLVSYKAPVFNYFFNPEVEVLRALSFMKLCLYSDAKKTVGDFNSLYYNDTKSFRKLMGRLGKNLKKYFALIYHFEKSGKAPSKLIKILLKNIRKEQLYTELRQQLQGSLREIDRAKSNNRGAFRTFLLRNLQDTAKSYQQITGGFIRSRLVSFYAQLYKSFEGMSYIKLEVLAQRKAKLYSFDETDRSRGDLKYIERNEKQYFWDFNGEFWADELGDYVFALKSEC